MDASGRLVILSGPSGVGKDTVIDAWRQRDPVVERVVAYTTRPPRLNEHDGIDYHFVTRERFLELVAQGAFLEHKEVHGNFYATPLHDLERMLAEGKIAILKIDVQGALDVMSLRRDALSVFILPPSAEELEHRIRFRGTESSELIQKRLETARWEISMAERYGRSIVNEDVIEVVDRLEELVQQSHQA